MTCSNCQSNPADPQTQLCGACATAFGVIVMPPTRRPARPCRACNGGDFVRVIPREFTQRGQNTHLIAPMTATLAPHFVKALLFDNYPGSPDIGQGLGLLEMVVCRGCGYVEWFCLDPENIPVGPQYMTERITLEGTTPYR